uniref:Uncharacterized protein n=1 Tax=Lepeophtheirus salmonis TaxID=72036 RepID=A0A0K2TWX4_LEPSM
MVPFRQIEAPRLEKKDNRVYPKSISHWRHFLPKARGGLGRMDLELQWEILIFSWYKRAHLVDYLCKTLYMEACRGTITNTPTSSPWKKLKPSNDILKVYWRSVGRMVL